MLSAKPALLPFFNHCHHLPVAVCDFVPNLQFLSVKLNDTMKTHKMPWEQGILKKQNNLHQNHKTPQTSVL